MSENWISATQIFDGYTLHNDHALLIENGKVVALKPITDIGPNETVKHHEGIITPGFFDIQVNGGGGVLLNKTHTPEGVRQIAEAHHSLGSVAIMPTVITDTPEVTRAAAMACLEAASHSSVMGVHIEGPHISHARRGTHSIEYIRDMDEETHNLVSELRQHNLPVIITIAPETTSVTDVERLTAIGATVSIGHSDADAQTTKKYIEAGAKCFTHLYNAMSPMLNRAPGVTGAGIASSAWCSIIADGIHVDATMVEIAVRARPVADRMIAVSDAMPTVGGPDEFNLYGKNIKLVNGELINSEGSLAGAHVSMVEAVKNLVSYGIEPEQALRMARHNPAQLLGIWDEMKFIGLPASDLILLSNEYEMKNFKPEQSLQAAS